MPQCCCGKYQMNLTDDEFIHNEVVHQVLGPPGNFCGAKHTHMVVRFEKEIEKLRNKIEELESDPDGRDQIYKKNLELISANQRLREEIKVFNPCGHSPVESAVCSICGYPWHHLHKINQELKNMIKQLLEAMGNATFQSFDDQIKLLCKKANEMIGG